MLLLTYDLVQNDDNQLNTEIKNDLINGIYILNYTNIYHYTIFSIVVYVNITNSFENYKLLLFWRKHKIFWLNQSRRHHSHKFIKV